MSALREPGFECPDCGTKLLSARRCVACGWKRGAESDDSKPKHSCWTCDRCHVYAPGQTVTYVNGRGLCGRCHFDERIRPYKSEPGEVCIAPECDGQGRHLIRDHMRQARALVAQLEAQMAVRA